MADGAWAFSYSQGPSQTIYRVSLCAAVREIADVEKASRQGDLGLNHEDARSRRPRICLEGLGHGVLLVFSAPPSLLAGDAGGRPDDPISGPSGSRIVRTATRVSDTPNF